MSPEKALRLRAIGTDPAIGWAATLSRIVTETDRHLDRLARSVGECKAVDEAANYCRWLQFSGVLQLPHPSFQRLRAKADDVLARVGEIYKGAKVRPQYDASDIAAINGKLDFLLSQVSQAPKQTDVVVETDEEPRAARLALPPARFTGV